MIIYVVFQLLSNVSFKQYQGVRRETEIRGIKMKNIVYLFLHFDHLFCTLTVTAVHKKTQFCEFNITYKNILFCKSFTNVVEISKPLLKI